MAKNKAKENNRKKKDSWARELLKPLSRGQLNEVGIMLGMGNLGLPELDHPARHAQSDEEYAGFMEEIKSWQKDLRDPKKTWGWCDELEELIKEAKKRYPG